MSKEHALLGIDIGASHIKCAVGVKNLETGVIDVISRSSNLTRGFEDGKITSAASFESSLQLAIDEAVEYAVCSPKEAIISVSSRASYRVEVNVNVRILSGQVSHHDVQTALERCVREAPNPTEAYKLSHVIPLRFSLDGQRHTLSPWGEPASHLELKASLVYGHQPLYEELWLLKSKLTVRGEGAGDRRLLPLIDVVDELSVLASAVLSAEEREGVMSVLDIGADCLKVVIFERARPLYTYTSFKAGRHLTRELLADLQLESFEEAERVKVEWANLSPEPNAQRVRVRCVAQVKHKQLSALGRPLERALKQQISALRVRLQQDQVWSYVQRGLILTGGTAQLRGLAQQTEAILQAPVRVGEPKQEGVCDLVKAPSYAILNGLILCALSGETRHWFGCWGAEIKALPQPELALQRAQRPQGPSPLKRSLQALMMSRWLKASPSHAEALLC
jgi:cell division protein FtsA